MDSGQVSKYSELDKILNKINALNIWTLHKNVNVQQAVSTELKSSVKCQESRATKDDNIIEMARLGSL